MFHARKWTIEGERLTLCPFTAADAPEVVRLCNDPEMSRGMLTLPYPYPLASAKEWIAAQPENFERARGFEFAVTDRADGTLYGCISLSNNGVHRGGELGYWIGKEYWNRGLATEAGKMLLRWAFEVCGFHRVYARHFAFNPASGRVMQKLGMSCEGTQRKHLFKNGRFEDVVLYGILAEEFHT